MPLQLKEIPMTHIKNQISLNGLNFFEGIINHMEKELSIKLFKYTGKTGEEIKFEVKINLNNIKKTGIYKSVWILKMKMEIN